MKNNILTIMLTVLIFLTGYIGVQYAKVQAEQYLVTQNEEQNIYDADTAETQSENEDNLFVMPWENQNMDEFVLTNLSDEESEVIQSLCAEHGVEKIPDMEVWYRQRDELYICYPAEKKENIIAFSRQEGIFAYDFPDSGHELEEEDTLEYMMKAAQYAAALKVSSFRLEQITWQIEELENLEQTEKYKAISDRWSAVIDTNRVYQYQNQSYLVEYNIQKNYIWMRFFDEQLNKVTALKLNMT